MGPSEGGGLWGLHRLWHCWLEEPRTPWILELGFQWFGSCAQFMTPANAACLLRGPMTAIDPSTASLATWTCFLFYFREVFCCLPGCLQLIRQQR